MKNETSRWTDKSSTSEQLSNWPETDGKPYPPHITAF